MAADQIEALQQQVKELYPRISNLEKSEAQYNVAIEQFNHFITEQYRKLNKMEHSFSNLLERQSATFQNSVEKINTEVRDHEKTINGNNGTPGLKTRTSILEKELEHWRDKQQLQTRIVFGLLTSILVGVVLVIVQNIT